MSIKRIDLNTYKKDSKFYGEIPLLLTIKSFDLQAIRERYIKSRSENKSRAGSTARREVAIGGVTAVTINKGKICHCEVLTKLPEPRGIHFDKGIFAFSSENKVYVVENDQLRTLENKWFSYIHTVDICNGNILVSSSGFDAIFEFNLKTFEPIYEWFAWEHGFNIGIDPANGERFILTRNNSEAMAYQTLGQAYMYIDNPARQSLPTAKRAAFINSVVYDTNDENKIIATFFHEGAVYSINKKNGVATKVMDKLKNPHGGMRLNNEYLATSTTGGEVALGKLNRQERFFLNNISGKPEYLAEMEWLQNSKTVKKNLIVIDSNRCAFVIINKEKELYDVIPFDTNWAVQDLVVAKLTEKQTELVMGIMSF